MNEKKNGTAGVAFSDADLAKMQLEALESIKDPEARIRAIADIRGGESIAIQRESLELQRSQARIVQNTDTVGLERARRANDITLGVAAGSREYTASGTVTFPLTECQGSPEATARVRLGGRVFGAGEERAGEHLVSSLVILDASWNWSDPGDTLPSAVEALLIADIKRLHANAKDEWIFSKQDKAGFPHRRFAEIYRPLHQKIIARRTLEELRRRKDLTLEVGEIVVSAEPLRTSLEAR